MEFEIELGNILGLAQGLFGRAKAVKLCFWLHYAVVT